MNNRERSDPLLFTPGGESERASVVGWERAGSERGSERGSEYP